MKLRPSLVGIVAGLLTSVFVLADNVRVHGSNRTTAPFLTVRETLSAQGLELQINSESSSSLAVLMVGQGDAEVGLTVRPVTSVERANAPFRQLTETPLAAQIVALLVPAKVWQSGVRQLSAPQLRSIYEGEITNWKFVGGPDLALEFHNPAQGPGAWELMATWLYGDQRRAPLGDQFPQVDGPAATRTSLLGSPGALAVGPADLADGREIFALEIALPEGGTVRAGLPDVKAGRYPLSRTLYFITGGRPAGDVLRLLNYFRAAEGEAALRKYFFTPWGS